MLSSVVATYPGGPIELKIEEDGLGFKKVRMSDYPRGSEFVSINKQGGVQISTALVKKYNIPRTGYVEAYVDVELFKVAFKFFSAPGSDRVKIRRNLDAMTKFSGISLIGDMPGFNTPAKATRLTQGIQYKDGMLIVSYRDHVNKPEPLGAADA